jgi:pyruvate formate lyase activating enzyme
VNGISNSREEDSPINVKTRTKPAGHGCEMTRRSFITASAAVLTTLAAGLPLPASAASKPFEARYYEKLPDGFVRCLLCPKKCLVGPGKRGACRVRENRNGTYYSLVYGQPCAEHLDPIEKKPFYHVMPGTAAFSIATVGCNLACKFCQNWQISQSRPEDVSTRFVPPDTVVRRALSAEARSIAYTYGEPVVFNEYVQDIAARGRESGLLSVVVSSGFINEKPLDDLCGLVDAIKIDLKAYTETYYRDICSAELRPVLDTILRIRRNGIWLELVYLMVPTLNDDPGEIREMARWLVTNVGSDVPIHFSRFFPQYRLTNLPPTPVSSLERAYGICREEGLEFVYIGNVPGHEYENTYCPSCSRVIISRRGYRISGLNIEKGSCRFCGHAIPGIWSDV